MAMQCVSSWSDVCIRCKTKAYSKSAAAVNILIILTNCVECSDFMKVCDDEECEKKIMLCFNKMYRRTLLSLIVIHINILCWYKTIYLLICKVCDSHECIVQIVPLCVLSVNGSYIFYNI